MVSKETINEIAQIIAADYQPDRIVLFGSYASGNSRYG